MLHKPLNVVLKNLIDAVENHRKNDDSVSAMHAEGAALFDAQEALSVYETNLMIEKMNG